MDLRSFRKRYPQYDDMDDGELAYSLHTKHYSDMPFPEFAKQIGYEYDKKSYPEPGILDRVKESLGPSEEPTTEPGPPPPGQSAAEQQTADTPEAPSRLEQFQQAAADLETPNDETVLRRVAATVGAGAAFFAKPIAGLATYEAKDPGKAVKAMEQVEALPMKLLKTDEDIEAIERVGWPFEKLSYAADWYGNKTTELTGDEDLGNAVATAIEAGVLLGLPKLTKGLRSAVRARKWELAREEIRNIHREKLAKLQAEPKHLAKLAEKEGEIRGLSREVPEFKNTGEAVRWGKKATAEQIKEVKALREESVKRQQDIKDPQARLDEATRSQFMREAVEASEGKIKTPEQIKAEAAKEPPPDTTLSFMGTQGIYEGLARSLPLAKEKAVQLGRAVHDAIDVETPYKRINSPETGFHMKNYFSQRARWEDFSVEYAKRNTRMYKSKRELAPEVVLAAEDPVYYRSLPKETRAQIRESVLHLRDYFEAARKDYAKHNVKLDFKQRIIRELDELKSITTDKAELRQINKALQVAERMEFVHIPSAMWFEGMMSKDPVRGMNKLRLLNVQKRKNLTIKSLVDKGIIEKGDIHPADVIASYGRRMGRDMALLNLVKAARKEGLASMRKSPGMVPPPPNAGILKGNYLHPVLHDAIFDMTRHYGRGGNPYRSLISLTKMTAFYNPLFLPQYDMVQQAMLHGVKRPYKAVPIAGAIASLAERSFRKGIRDVWKKTPDYYEALDNGLASKPFNNPFRNWQDMVNAAKNSPMENLMSNFRPNVLKTVYNASWNWAWRLDETVRMASYNYLKSKGLSAREAAQTAALYHSDYASVPVKLRRNLNAFLFTPTFKITMGKLYTKSIKAALDVMAGAKDAGSARLANGILGAMALQIGFDQLMTGGLGFERDEFGRRYVKNVDTPEGEKQLVMVYSNPANMFNKYYYRYQNATQPEVDKPLVSFLEQNIWEIHPLYRVGYQIANNDNGRGDAIYNRWDDKWKQNTDKLWYSFKSIVAIMGTMDKELSNKEAQDKFAEETNRIIEVLTRPFSFKYMRSREDRRKAYKVRKLVEDFKKMRNRRLRRGEQFNPDWKENFEQDIEDIRGD